MTELRNGTNVLEAVGTVSEYELTVKQNERKCIIDGEETKIKSAIIYGKIILNINEDNIEFKVLVNKHTKSGEETRNFKGLCHLAGVDYKVKDNEVVYFRDKEKMLTSLIGGKSTIIKLGQDKNSKDLDILKTEGSNNATRVTMKGSLNKNLYLNTDQSDIVVGKQLNINTITTEAVEKDKCSFDIEGYVSNISDEIDNSGRATGKKFIEIINVGYFGNNVFTLAIPKEWTAEDEDGEYVITSEQYAEACPVGSTIIAHGDIESETIGKVVNTSGKRTIGNRSNIVQGYKRIDWFTKGADIEPKNSPNAYNSKDMNEAMNEWNIYLDAEYDKKKKEAEENYKKKQEEESKITNTSRRGLGNRSRVSQSVSVENNFNISDEDSPF